MPLVPFELPVLKYAFVCVKSPKSVAFDDAEKSTNSIVFTATGALFPLPPAYNPLVVELTIPPEFNP